MGLMFFFVACNDDDPERAYDYSGNLNSNATQTEAGAPSYGKIVNYGNVRGVTEGNTDICEVANRLEIPRLRGGAKNLFIVHTTDEYGVNYCVEWNCELRAQYWSAFRWDKSNTLNNTSRSEAWANNPLIPADCISTQADYSGSGYTRGHILASQDRVNSLEANMQTFYFSNIHPQLYGFNTQVWLEMERRLRNIYNKNSFRDTLYVVKGGTISQGMYNIPQNMSIPVPKYFFMAILRQKSTDKSQNGFAAMGFWIEHKANSDTELGKYAVSIDRLEELTGIDFFCNLPDDIEEQVESNYVPAVWKFN